MFQDENESVREFEIIPVMGRNLTKEEFPSISEQELEEGNLSIETKKEIFQNK